jgi:chemotaxis protein CheD
MIGTSREVRVKVAEWAVATEGTLVTIGLGSCVAIVLYDDIARVAGMAHVLLPSQEMSRDRTMPGKFPGTAVPVLVAEMRALGADVQRLRAKIVGGASMFRNLLAGGGVNIGERNVSAARDALGAAGIPIVAEDTGLDYGRSVAVFADDGRVEVRSLRRGSHVL